MSLISASEMAALRDVAESGMISTVMVLRRSTVETASGQGDYWPTTGPTYKGWLYELTSESASMIINAGSQAVSEHFRLMVPVGTDILSGDHVVIGSTTYTVINTNADSTYLPDLNCSLRRLE